MIEISVGKGFTELEYYECCNDRRQKLGKTKGPQVLWDTDRIAEQKNARRIVCQRCSNKRACDSCTRFDKYRRSQSTVAFRDATYHYPPELFTGVDSFLLIDAVLDGLGHDRTVTSLMDVGAGIGLIGLALAKEIKSLTHVYLTDINEVARTTILRNISENGLTQDFAVFCGPGFRCVPQGTKVDLIVSAPPYIPTPRGFRASNGQDQTDSTAVFSLQLLESLFLEGPAFSNRIVVLYSELCKPEVDELKARSKPVHVETLLHRTIPLTIRSATTNERWRNTLLQRGLRHKPRDRYPYWQVIRAELVSY